MSEKGVLIAIHFSLFMLQLLVGALAIMVKPEFVTLNVGLGVAQAYFPNPFKN